MTSDELVRSLVSDLRPVRPLPGVGWRTFLWVAFALFCATAVSVALGQRPDLVRNLLDPVHLREDAMLLLAFVLSARSAFRLSVPGLEPRPLARALPLVALLLWIGALVARDASGAGEGIAQAARSLAGLHCVQVMTLLALAPVVAAFIMLRRAAPLRRGWTGFFALLAAGSLAILATRTICGNDQPGHILVWHLVPTLLAGLLGVVAGQLFLRPVAGKRGPR